jgi:anaerobic ribonucleoside-triphosphate reductase activating protein
MRIQLNKAHYPVTSLGYGRRIGIWLQGCSIGCPGCVSRDTWAADTGREVELDLLLSWCQEVVTGDCAGVTISGGEPFEQPAALAALIDGLRAWSAAAPDRFDILCYSGLPLGKLTRDHGDILARIDALIPEPYVATLPRGRVWRGSVNQPLVPLSDLGRTRYGLYVDASPDGKGQFQVTVDDDCVWGIGIPDRDDMERLEAAARARGIALGAVSWRA